jgi:hypothetical protein
VKKIVEKKEKNVHPSNKDRLFSMVDIKGKGLRLINSQQIKKRENRVKVYCDNISKGLTAKKLLLNVPQRPF